MYEFFMARIGTVVVYGFEIFTGERKPEESGKRSQSEHEITQDVFNEFRPLVCFFRHILLIFAFQQRINWARCLLLYQCGKLFDEDARDGRLEFDDGLLHGQRDVAGTVTPRRKAMGVPALFSPSKKQSRSSTDFLPLSGAFFSTKYLKERRSFAVFASRW